VKLRFRDGRRLPPFRRESLFVWRQALTPPGVKQHQAEKPKSALGPQWPYIKERQAEETRKENSGRQHGQEEDLVQLNFVFELRVQFHCGTPEEGSVDRKLSSEAKLFDTRHSVALASGSNNHSSGFTAGWR
jgi:hypothetical protein